MESTAPFFTMHERRVRKKILKTAGVYNGNLTIPFSAFTMKNAL